MNDLEKAYLRAGVENEEQFRAVLRSDVELIYIDAGYFDPVRYTDMVQEAYNAGKSLGLRFPQVFREEVEHFLDMHFGEIIEAGFEAFLIRNPETLYWILDVAGENGRSEDIPQLVLDHTVYSWNSLSEEMLREMLPDVNYRETYPLEINASALAALADLETEIEHELVVYGRAPMMVTAQCVRRTVTGCDHHSCVMYLRDRKDAVMPVKNCCTFCVNTIYNSVPTAVFDMQKEISDIHPDSIRFEFTTEDADEVLDILDGARPAEFTRGHFRKSAE